MVLSLASTLFTQNVTFAAYLTKKESLTQTADVTGHLIKYKCIPSQSHYQHCLTGGTCTIFRKRFNAFILKNNSLKRFILTCSQHYLALHM